MKSEQLISILKKNLLPPYSITGDPIPLNGGLINYVWRVSAYPCSLIAKYAPPYIATVPSIAIDSKRLHVEHQALKWLDTHKFFWEPGPVLFPRPILFLPQNNLLLMEDLGKQPSLGEWISSESVIQRAHVYQQLGNFLGILHQKTHNDQALFSTFQNHSIQQTRAIVQYNLLDSLQSADLTYAPKIAEEVYHLGQKILAPGSCLIMGDFWPNSILLSDSRIGIIDWEFAHFGHEVQDVAHMAAHLWLLEEEELVPLFLNAYREQLNQGFPIERIQDCYVHFGAEILTRTIGVFQDHPGSDSTVQMKLDVASQSILNKIGPVPFDCLV